MKGPKMNASALLLRRLRWASLAEGATLILLVCLAVPLKRMAGMPEFVSFMGPLHGAAFLIYLLMVMRAVSAGLFSAVETLLLLLVAFVPFGAFFMTGLFRRKAAAWVGVSATHPRS
jgi:integral membrane protein